MSDVRRLPAPPDGQRVETGPTQFGGDWTGIFIRGDQALYLAAMLAGIPEPKHDWLAATVLSNLRKLLATCEHRAPAPPDNVQSGETKDG